MFGMSAYKYVDMNSDLGVFGSALRNFELSKKRVKILRKGSIENLGCV